MDFKNFRVNIVVRVLLIILTIFLLANLVNDSNDDLIVPSLITVLLILQILSLIKFLEKTNRELAGFLNSIKYDDFSHTYPTTGSGSSMDMLYREFNKVMNKFREIRAEKEAHYHYLKTIVQHVGIGLITFNKEGEIQIINTAAKRLFKINQIKNINGLRSLSETLVESFFRLKTGGRDLIKIDHGGDNVQLAIYAIELTLRGEEFKLISVQNIQSELEEKEMEAWHKLIRVLTHEIMNSVTPISSLAATVEEELGSQLDNNEEMNTIPNDEIQDLQLAVSTIHRRSEGLIRFVSDFRNLTRIPEPKLENVRVMDLFDRIITLMSYEFEENDINVSVSVVPETLVLNIDQELIEQVLINLIKNASQAMVQDDDDPENPKEKNLTLKAYQDSKHTFIIIKDNGPGIEEEALTKIFIPFFTTKKDGSGIGLSLSRQIMRQHNGIITAKSTINQGTEFTLRF
ncbi:ATP-binding protein [Fulvivirgaceae bacterium BMA10]|uniref:histidine kinase n=1 Tax=Splendidivirga corallicola TaxID=3051826 RepID=A0ABT8KRK0_9BACT|nr:ATP-binding protein [Fulvivirgaceae bacterium BMA10]